MSLYRIEALLFWESGLDANTEPCYHMLIHRCYHLQEPTFPLSTSALKPDSPSPTSDADKQGANGKSSDCGGRDKRKQQKSRKSDIKLEGCRRGQDAGNRQGWSAATSENGLNFEPQDSSRHADWDDMLDASYKRMDAILSRNSQVVYSSAMRIMRFLNDSQPLMWSWSHRD